MNSGLSEVMTHSFILFLDAKNCTLAGEDGTLSTGASKSHTLNKWLNQINFEFLVYALCCFTVIGIAIGSIVGAVLLGVVISWLIVCCKRYA